MQPQQTLGVPVELAGVALHSGIPVHMRLLPAPANTGIVFRRLDLPGQPEIAATVGNVRGTNRNTSLGLGSAQVMTSEHLIAALRGTGVDNVYVELDGGEIPAGDGSALVFVEMIHRAGLRRQGAPRQYYRLMTPVWVSRGNAHMVALPGEDLTISYTFVSDHPAVGTQFGEYTITQGVFEREIAPARTLVFEEDVKMLHGQGLGLGGTLDSVVMVGERDYCNPLRFEDEIVRHKILDVVGDMGLLGFLQAHIFAIRSGHELNNCLMQSITEQMHASIGVGNW